MVDKDFKNLSLEEKDQWEKLKSDDIRGALYSSFGYLKILEKIDKEKIKIVYFKNEKIEIGIIYYEFLSGSNDYYDV